MATLDTYETHSSNDDNETGTDLRDTTPDRSRPSNHSSNAATQK